MCIGHEGCRQPVLVMRLHQCACYMFECLRTVCGVCFGVIPFGMSVLIRMIIEYTRLMFPDVPVVPAGLHGSIDESDLEGPTTTKILTELKADDDLTVGDVNPIGVVADAMNKKI
jgi:hypothetical protein